jgi:hypothetical protein
MKCRPARSAAKPQAASQISPTYQRSDASGIQRISRGKPQATGANSSRNNSCSADAMPVQQDQREHAPDREIVQAGVAQDALAHRLAQDAELFHQQDQDRQRRHRARHADTEHELPAASRLRPSSPRASQHAERRRTAEQISGTPSARPAVMPHSRRCSHTCFRSSSITSRTTNTTVRSISARKPFGCGRRRIRARRS